MSHRLSIQPEAAEEANHAFNWYEDRQPGLGGEFYRELARCLEFIVDQPLAARIAYRGLRMRRLRRFPYQVIYESTDAKVSIVSVFHGHRDPKVWKQRARKH